MMLTMVVMSAEITEFSEMCPADMSPFCIQLRMSEGLQAGDPQDGGAAPTCTQFDFSPTNLEQLQEDEHENFWWVVVPL